MEVPIKVVDPETLLNVTIMHEAFANAMERIERAQALKDRREDPCCLALMGESGSGKSFVLDRLEEKNPPIETDEGTLKPIVRASVPSKPTIKSLAEEIKSQLDPNDTKTRYTENQLTRRITVLMDECETDVIVLDEFQHFYDSTTEKMWEHAADWLKRLIEVRKKNGTRRMLIVSGLIQSMEVIQQNSQLKRRFKAPLFLPCYSWATPRERAEFAACYNGFAEVVGQHLVMPDVKKNAMYFRFYCATGGLIAYLKALMHEVVEVALKEDKVKLELKDFATAFNEFLFSNPDLKVSYQPFSKSFNVMPNESVLEQAFLIAHPPTLDRGRKMSGTTTTSPSGSSLVAKELAQMAS
jgi:hypothetical protein